MKEHCSPVPQSPSETIFCPVRIYESETILDRQPLNVAHLCPWWVLRVTEILAKLLKLLLSLL